MTDLPGCPAPEKTNQKMSKASSRDLPKALEKAWAKYYKGDFDAALEQFEELVEVESNPDTLYGRACALFRCQENEGAIKDLNALIKSDPNDIRALHTRALVYGDEEKYKEAIRDLEKVVSLKPGSLEAWCDLGGACLMNKDYAKAGDCFDKCLDLDKTFPEAWFGKGMAALEKKEARKAIEFFNAAIKLDGKYLLAIMARAEAHFMFKQKAEGLKDVARATAIEPEIFKNTEGDQDDGDGYEDDEEGSMDDDQDMETF